MRISGRKFPHCVFVTVIMWNRLKLFRELTILDTTFYHEDDREAYPDPIGIKMV